MTEVNKQNGWRGVSIEGLKGYFVGVSGLFYIDKRGSVAQIVGREKRIGV